MGERKDTMPRSRMIKPELWDDEKLATVSRDARLTFIGMWTNSDDWGVVKGNHIWLKNQIFPYDNINSTTFKKWLIELENIGVIQFFSAHSESYYNIKNWSKHQKVDHPSKSFRNPSAPETFPKDSRGSRDETEVKLKLKQNINRSKTETNMSGKRDKIPYQEIIEDLNKRRNAKKPYSSEVEAHRKHIRARWGELSGTEEEKLAIFIYVNTVKCAQWLDDEKMSQYLRPSTLYNRDKFHGYAGQAMPDESRHQISNVTRHNLKAAEDFVNRGKEVDSD